MLHARKAGTACLVFLISFAVFSGSPAEGADAPFPAFWEWALGWLPLDLSPSSATEPPRPGEPGYGEEDDLGPEIDPNGNPPVRATGGTGISDRILRYTPVQTGNFSSPEKTR